MFKYVTFNIRYDCERDGRNQFVYRQPLILRAIREEKPDIIGFQEVMVHMAAWLKENLTDYYVIGCGRNRGLNGEQMSVAFRKDKYNLVEMRTFWLSETPFQAGSKYSDSACPRTCTEAVFVELESRRPLRVLNTHLDYMGHLARMESIQQIMRHVNELSLFPDAPIILAGDFNATPESEELKAMAQAKDFKNVTTGIGVTFHGFMQEPNPSQIDYIFVRGGLNCQSVKKWDKYEENGVYISDHYPVCAELEWENQA